MRDLFRRMKNYYLQWILSEEDSYFSIQNQEKIRKNWLTVLYYFIAMGVGLLFLYFFGLLEVDFTHRFIWIFVVGSLLFASLISYMVAYQKLGAICLMFYIIFLPLWELSNLATYKSWSGLALLRLAAILGMKILFWIHCMRLYKIHLYRKREQNKLIYIKKGDSGF